MNKVLFVATVTSHINAFHIPYLKWFKDHGYEVHVASRGEKPKAFCDKHYNLPFERFPFKIQNIQAYKTLKKIINENQYTVIHCHTPVGSVLTRLAAKKMRKKGITKVIYTAHGFHFFNGAPLINWLIYYPIEKIMAKYTDCLITINQEDYEFAKKNLKVNQIEFIHGVGIDKNKFNVKMREQDRLQLKKELGIKEKDFIIIYPAELSKRKNQIMILKVVKQLKDEGIENIKVLLPGKDSMNGLYNRMAKQLQIENNIKFLGFRDDIPQLMKISDLLISTAKQEGLPVNLMEAMFAGLPIVATNCRGNRDLAKIIVDIDDVKTMKNEIKRCMQNEKIDINYDKEKYELKNVMKEMEKIYKKYIKRKDTIYESRDSNPL